MAHHDERFHYCLELERSLKQLFGTGPKWDGMAGAFQDVAMVREGLLAAANRVQRRLDDILTADDRLRLTTSIEIEALKKEVRKLREGSNNELEVIAHLLSLVGYLLGFDWYLGIPNREVVYFQTAKQQALDDAKRHPKESYPLEFEKRVDIARSLYDEGLRMAQIARIMKLSVYVIKGFLVRTGGMHRQDQTKST